MNQPRSQRARLIAGFITAALVALLGSLLLSPGLPAGSKLMHESYDSLHRLTASPADAMSNSPVLLVYLDLDSYLSEHQELGEMWPRRLHAQLLERLGGARAVVFDFVFDQPARQPGADETFANALRRHGRVVLAAELNAASQSPGTSVWIKSLTLLLPDEKLRQAAAGWGIATFQTDEDFTMRQSFPGWIEQQQPSLTWAAAELLKLPVTAEAGWKKEKWIRYYGPALTVPHVSYARALSNDLAPDFFRDKIVLVGARPFVGSFRERRDEHRNPFHAWRENNLFMPAVEVHATQMLNLVRGDWLQRWSSGSEREVLFAFAFAFGLGLMWLRPVAATALALVGAGGTLVAARYGFQHGVWFPWLIVSAVQIPAALFSSILFHFFEWYRTRRRMEAAQRIADAKIREQAALIDKAHDAILVQDLTGRVLYANPSAEKLYGWSLSELQREGSAAEISEPDATRTLEARAAVEARGDWSGELRQKTRAGQTLTVETRWTLIRDEANQPKSLLMINSDITDKKQLEAQFLRTQRMETIGSLAGGMAHDLNNALSPVLLGVQLLRRKSADEESTRILGLMETSTHRGADMVRQVLLFARGKEGDLQRLNTSAVVKEIEKMARETFPRNVVIESFIAADAWPVRGNVTQLHQVLLNLCVNARDAMPDGGRLSLIVDNTVVSPAEAAQMPGAEPGQFISIGVSDTGSGMTAEVRAKIFEPFFTTKSEGQGTGLGLATVQRIVKNHGGFMRLESEPGQGTTFEVLLPRPVDGETTVAIDPSIELPRGQGELILVADDEQAIRELLIQGLSAQGFRVLSANNGLEALRLFRENSDAVRLVITDSAMPELDGAHTIAALRELKANLPAILMSGGDDEIAAKKLGAAFLGKPFALEEALSLVVQTLRR